jgi:hypothetical protein
MFRHYRASGTPPICNSCALSLICSRWCFDRVDLAGYNICLPSDVLDLKQRSSHETRLHVDSLPWGHPSHSARDWFQRATVSSLMTSLSLGVPTPPVASKLPHLKAAILRCPRLEVLRYQDRGQGTHFKFHEGERMPAVREMSLKSYDWCHSSQEVERHWDFSNLRQLELIAVPSYPFLSSVPFHQFARLTKFHMEDYSAHLEDHRPQATAQLGMLIGDHIKHLEDLSITCDTQSFQLEAILKQGATLRHLKFRDHVGFENESVTCPTLTESQVGLLSNKLHQLRSLELDMDIRLCDPKRFLQSVSGFPRLVTLCLHVQTLLPPVGSVVHNSDADYEAALETFSFLLQTREMLHPHVHWKTITIIVGGWRRVQIRRLGPVWRARNEKGIYAERCFILERSDDGQYGVREERSIESTSNRSTPEI